MKKLYRKESESNSIGIVKTRETHEVSPESSSSTIGATLDTGASNTASATKRRWVTHSVNWANEREPEWSTSNLSNASSTKVFTMPRTWEKEEEENFNWINQVWKLN